MNTSDYQTSKKSLSNHHPNFTVLLGDNFYDYGVSSVNDSLWGLFDSISHISPIFYAVLGNHDYGQSINSQIYYTQINPIWAMPARYFYKLIPFGHQYICAIFFDSYNEALIKSISKTKIILGATTTEKYKTLSFKATNVKSFLDFQKELEREIKLYDSDEDSVDNFEIISKNSK
jgi:hypothetical protein